MDTDILITAITAAFTIITPIVIQWRKQPEWSQLLKVGLPVLASLAIAIAYLATTGALAGLSLLAAFLIVYGLQQLVYATIIKNISGLMSNVGRHEAGDGYPIADEHEPTQPDENRYL